tara:strand:+ start:565 stop:924 length:360 start_codon:yes stop_codon:yes gene_type:complete
MRKEPSKEKLGGKLSTKKKKELKNSIKAHDFSGNRYKIIWKRPSKELAGGDAWGLCEDNKAPEKTIHVDPNLSEYDFLATCLDEAIHGCNFSISNEYVDSMSSSIAYFLWRIGFRLEKD